MDEKREPQVQKAIERADQLLGLIDQMGTLAEKLQEIGFTRKAAIKHVWRMMEVGEPEDEELWDDPPEPTTISRKNAA